MSKEPTRPEDILKDNEDFTVVQGVRIRKGTIAATLENIAILETGDTEQRDTALMAIREYAPALVALGVHRYFSCHNQEVENILVETAEEMGQ